MNDDVLQSFLGKKVVLRTKNGFKYTGIITKAVEGTICFEDIISGSCLFDSDSVYSVESVRGSND